MFLFGPPNIEKMKSRHNIKGLIEALGYEKDAGETRRRSAQALIEIGVPAVEPLVAAIKDKGWDPRFGVGDTVVEVLVKIGTSAVEPIVNMLKDNSEVARRFAATVLGQVGDTRATEPLIAALRDEDPLVRKAAADALGQIGDPRAVEPLLGVLQNVYEAAAAAWALGRIGDCRAVEPLIAILEKTPRSAEEHFKERLAPGYEAKWELRKEAARALGQIGDPRAVKPLIAALGYVRNTGSLFNVTVDTQVSDAAAEALVRIGTPAVKSLRVALKSKDDRIRATAAKLLDEISKPLLSAAEFGDIDQVKALLKSGVYVDVVDREKTTPLGNAAVGGHTEVMALLLERGANPNAQNKDGITPLMRAAGSGHIEAVKLLLERGADVSITDKDGMSAIEFAEALGQAEIAKLLRNHQQSRMADRLNTDE